MLTIRYRAGSAVLTDVLANTEYDLNSDKFSPDKRGKPGNVYPSLHRAVCIAKGLVTP